MDYDVNVYLFECSNRVTAIMWELIQQNNLYKCEGLNLVVVCEQ